MGLLETRLIDFDAIIICDFNNSFIPKISLKDKFLSTKDDSNLNLRDENFTKDKNIYTTNFSLNEETNWIITGSFKVEDETGFIFIKTNAK